VSTSSERRVRCGGGGGGGAGTAVTGAIHSVGKLPASGAVPHCSQRVRPARISALHFGHCMSAHSQRDRLLQTEQFATRCTTLQKGYIPAIVHEFRGVSLEAGLSAAVGNPGLLCWCRGRASGWSRPWFECKTARPPGRRCGDRRTAMPSIHQSCSKTRERGWAH
jgi:hypothetical protein